MGIYNKEYTEAIQNVAEQLKKLNEVVGASDTTKITVNHKVVENENPLLFSKEIEKMYKDVRVISIIYKTLSNKHVAYITYESKFSQPDKASGCYKF